jgi:hypothetical protein
VATYQIEVIRRGMAGEYKRNSAASIGKECEYHYPPPNSSTESKTVEEVTEESQK